MGQTSKTWVLVRSPVSGDLFILRRGILSLHSELGSPYKDSEVVAESDDRAELERFRNLTEES